MPQTFTLKETEELLWKLIVAPEGVPQALEAYQVSALPIVGDARLSNSERLDIYANMYFFRIRDSLREDFPAVLRLLGEDRFHNLVTDYLLQYPPRHWSLRYAGESLPGFLSSHAISQRYPCLPDLARFEWALLEAFDAPDGSPLSHKSLQAIAPRDWGEIRFQLVPSVRCYQFQWPVDKIQKSLVEKGRVQNSRPRGTDLVVWRKGFRVFCRRLEALEERLLEEILRRKTFGSLCQMVSEELGEEKAVRRLHQYVQSFLSDAMLSVSC